MPVDTYRMYSSTQGSGNIMYKQDERLQIQSFKKFDEIVSLAYQKINP